MFGITLAGCSGNSAKDFKWKMDNRGRIAITSYLGESRTVKIPAKLDDRKVTFIGPKAFEDRLLTIVTIGG
jgi:hypothetical protein